jgi:hypothetical protein
MADDTLSLNSRESEDSEVVDITEITPDGHRIAQDLKSVLGGADYVSL